MSLFGKTRVEKTDIEKRFKLIGRVGQGSMSKVWRAEDKMSGNFVAVKLLDVEKTKRFEDRFKGLNKPSEADIALEMKHPYIVKTLEVGWTLEEEMYLVMDYVEGSGLSLLVDLQSEEMTRYRSRFLIQIGEALEYFHKQGFIHRDICPRNIMVTDDHKIRLIDFGLAVPSTPDFCKPGNRTGTANYMAPELIKRRPTDERIDVFSYAVTCYEMYATRHPWDAAQTLDAVMQHINQPPVELLELVPRMDVQIAETIMKGLAMDPADRWQTVAEMVKEFRTAEKRLVNATKDLLAKRKRRAAGKDGADSPSKTGKPKAARKASAESKSPPAAAPNPAKPSGESKAPGKKKPAGIPKAAVAAKTKVPAKAARKPEPEMVSTESVSSIDDSEADILATGLDDAPPAAAKKPPKPPTLKIPPVPAAPAEPAADSSDSLERSDDDILALPDD